MYIFDTCQDHVSAMHKYAETLLEGNINDIPILRTEEEVKDYLKDFSKEENREKVFNMGYCFRYPIKVKDENGKEYEKLCLAISAKIAQGKTSTPLVLNSYLFFKELDEDNSLTIRTSGEPVLTVCESFNENVKESEYWNKIQEQTKRFFDMRNLKEIDFNQNIWENKV